MDVYIAPYNGNVNANGWKVSTDYGTQLILKDGSPGIYPGRLGARSKSTCRTARVPRTTSGTSRTAITLPVGIAKSTTACDSSNYGHARVH